MDSPSCPMQSLSRPRGTILKPCTDVGDGFREGIVDRLDHLLVLVDVHAKRQDLVLQHAEEVRRLVAPGHLGGELGADQRLAGHLRGSLLLEARLLRGLERVEQLLVERRVLALGEGLVELA